MASKRPRPPTRTVANLKPLLRPVIEPVLDRLARNEQLLRELKSAMDIQFKRTASIQAQLDRVSAHLAKRRT